MKIYEMIIDDGKNVFKCVRPAETKKALTKMYSGNGEFVRIKEVTEEYKINLDKLYNTLKKENYKEEEIDIIISTLQITNISE